jgi:hypothetical protein
MPITKGIDESMMGKVVTEEGSEPEFMWNGMLDGDR